MRFSGQTYQITIESYTATRDASGGEVRTWTEFSKPYASIRYAGATERLEGDRTAETRKALFKVRYNSDTKNITAKMRIVYESANWDITGLAFLGRNDGIELTAIRKDG